MRRGPTALIKLNRPRESNHSHAPSNPQPLGFVVSHKQNLSPQNPPPQLSESIVADCPLTENKQLQKKRTGMRNKIAQTMALPCLKSLSCLQILKTSQLVGNVTDESVVDVDLGVFM